MRRTATMTRPITELTRESVAGAPAATIRSNTNRMSHWYIPPKTAEINRQPQRLEIIVSNRKQTPAPQINRQQTRTSQIQFRHASSSRSFIRSAFNAGPLTATHCPFRQEAAIMASSAAAEFPRLTVLLSRPGNLSSLIAHHWSLPPSRRTCHSAKKQQIRPSRSNPLGLYFLASYAHFPIGTRRALMHTGGTEVTAGYNDKKIHTAVVGMEPSREHQSVIR